MEVYVRVDSWEVIDNSEIIDSSDSRQEKACMQNMEIVCICNNHCINTTANLLI